MRRFLLIFFLLALPFQFTWGAAALYCTHEASDTVSHIGHHTHAHQKAVSDTGSAELLAIADDTDCGYCHLACVQPVVGSGVSVSFVVESVFMSPTFALKRFRVPTVIERPNWSLAIQSGESPLFSA